MQRIIASNSQENRAMPKAAPHRSFRNLPETMHAMVLDHPGGWNCAHCGFWFLPYRLLSAHNCLKLQPSIGG